MRARTSVLLLVLTSATIAIWSTANAATTSSNDYSMDYEIAANNSSETSATVYSAATRIRGHGVAVNTVSSGIYTIQALTAKGPAAARVADWRRF